ncbi:hypothetical protein [Hyphomonas sp. CY54-11-8]|uniref:hypothetical protein n=1 Tax=Hyphomonas sp. CY54-11-8 TaxID=1280944 RepID=UPI0012DFBE10|nr:hypothetical protein [Hyphomonas sp. CY54-11-8]
MIRIHDIFDRLGGISSVRDIIQSRGEDVPYQTVASWRSRNGYIPQHYHPSIVQHAQQNGIDVTYELLAKAAENERKLKAAGGKAVA